MDRVNRHLRFGIAYQPEEHSAYVFPGERGGSELDLRPSGLIRPEDAGLYARIADNLVTYLANNFTRPPALPPVPEPVPRRRTRRRASDPVDGFAVGSIVASALGLALFCIPIAGLPLGALGAVLGLVSLNQRRGNRSLAVAGLVLGAVAAVIAGLFFLALLVGEANRDGRR